MGRYLQFNVRVSKEAHDAIEAAVFVRELRSAQPLLGPAVERLASDLAKDPAVKTAVKLRRSTQTDAPPRVTPLRKRR